MTNKPESKPDNPEQYARFLETAKKLEAIEEPAVFDKAFKKVTAKKPSR